FSVKEIPAFAGMTNFEAVRKSTIISIGTPTRPFRATSPLSGEVNCAPLASPNCHATFILPPPYVLTSGWFCKFVLVVLTLAKTARLRALNISFGAIDMKDDYLCLKVM
ncbi:MAG: hypothetical protein ACKVOE_09275, partial [Rickettsiales bacterium]